MDGEHPVLGGSLQYAVLVALWDAGPLSAREVHDRVGVPLKLVYTTTTKVLERLHAKGLVNRRRPEQGLHLPRQRRAAGRRPRPDLEDARRPPGRAAAARAGGAGGRDPINESGAAGRAGRGGRVAPENVDEPRYVLAGLILCVCGSLTVLFGLLSFGRESPRLIYAAACESRTKGVAACCLNANLAGLGGDGRPCGWAAQPGNNRRAADPLDHGARVAVVGCCPARGVARPDGAPRPRERPTAVTVGLVRPRVRIDERLRDAVPAPSLAAVQAHEEAHARHRDPLRIWLAQTITDLQWPGRHARAPYESGSRRWSWRATRRPAVTASPARTEPPPSSPPPAGGSRARPRCRDSDARGNDLARRIHRLLGSLPAPPAAARSWIVVRFSRDHPPRDLRIGPRVRRRDRQSRTDHQDVAVDTICFVTTAVV